jgi:hypothetical protein
VTREPLVDVPALDDFQRALQATREVILAAILARESQRMPLSLEPSQ